jgi:hypothetical protein
MATYTPGALHAEDAEEVIQITTSVASTKVVIYTMTWREA